MDENGSIRDMPDMARLRNEIWAVSIDDRDTQHTIQGAWEHHHLLLEPHGAVGWLGLSKYLEAHPTSTTAVSVETAHPAKFPEEIEKLLGFSPEIPSSLTEVEQKEEHYRAMPADYAAFHQLLLDTY
jgi:threonine synthase